MSKFTKHFKMSEACALEYAKEKAFFDNEADLECKEIGDGNINYVFRVKDKVGKSIIIKHADATLRMNGRDLGTDRSRIEAEIYSVYSKLVPKLVPQIYLYDPVMCCIVMEDLHDYENMRYALVAHKTFPRFAEDISTFMAETLMRTTDNVTDILKKKGLVGSFINPELCQISERLVFTEPYTDFEGTNVLLAENAEFFKEEIYKDKALCLEAAKLKEIFKNNTQALIHGDLHTGSIFIKQDSTKVLDPEFAFYGPIGYDLGNVVANLLFAWVNAEVTLENGSKKSDFQTWIENAMIDTVDLFVQKSLKILENNTNDPMAKVEGFAEWYLDGILADTAGMAGMEINRRIVGVAKVVDIAGIKDVQKRKIAERICVLCAKQFILNRKNKYKKGREYVDTIHQIAAGFR